MHAGGPFQTDPNVENFTFDSPSTPPAPAVPTHARPWALVGVLASGNLEVLVEPADPGAGCRVDVETSAHGFGEVWAAVVAEFFDQHRDTLGGLRFTVHDAGATPAVVALRLEQAWREFRSP